ncbi:MAG: NAD(P)/FAD-dependent oxidoreductase [Clostridia bacterium]|nr:NAD(P)/FAD-dependent oxidoreductase [Clostridia bacterium]
MYDCAIIGTGPAGVSAALNLKIHDKHFLWFGRRGLSEKLSRAERISNYPGFIDAPGKQLCEAFRAQVEAMGIEIDETMVNAIMPMGDHYALSAGPDFYETRTLILATGVNQAGALPGEAERVGMGVSYCATCDGGLYRGRTVAVVCGNRRFEHEAAYLASLAAKVYLFPYYRDPGAMPENVTVMSAKPVAVTGAPRLEALKLNDGSELPVDGLFCLRDSISLNTLLPKLQLSGGHIEVDRAMATNLPGCFAAGDCTGRPYQYTKAVGEGNVAAHSVIDYLAEKRPQ